MLAFALSTLLAVAPSTAGADATPAAPSPESPAATPPSPSSPLAPIATPPPPSSPLAPIETPRWPHPLHVSYAVTVPVTVTALGASTLLQSIGESDDPPTACVRSPDSADVCPSLGALSVIDEVALGHYNDDAATASDVIGFGVAIGGSVLVNFAEAIHHGCRGRRGNPGCRPGTGERIAKDFVILSESVSLALATTNVLKSAVRRPRPVAHFGEQALEEDPQFEGLDVDGDLGRSFPSGHATLAFSSVTSATMLLALKQCPNALRVGSRCRRTRNQKTFLGLVGGFGLAAATTTAILRVVAGKHYPSDVLAGSFIGTTFGMVVPLLHRPRR